MIGFVSLARGLAVRATVPVVLGALLLSLKPHLYLLIAVVVAVVLALRRDVRTMVAVVAVLGTVIGAAFAAYPEAAAAILHGAGGKAEFGGETTWQLGASLVPGTDYGVIAVFAVALLAMALTLRYAPAERRLDAFLAATAALSIAYSFYIQLYDHVMTLPAFCVALALADPLPAFGRRALVAIAALAVVGWSWLMVFVARSWPDAVGLQGALPLIVLALLTVCAWAGRQWGGARPRIAGPPARHPNESVTAR